MIDFKPFEYQQPMIDWLKERKEAALFCSPGLGKSVCTLSAWKWLYDDLASKGVLIIAPIRVCNITWPNELEKWSFCKGLRIANLRTPEGIEMWEKGTADVYVLNSEQLNTREVHKLCPECKDGRRWLLTFPYPGWSPREFLGDTKAEIIEQIEEAYPDFDWQEEGCKLTHFRRDRCECCLDEGTISSKYPGFIAKHIKGKKKHELPVDTLVIDELSLAKSHKSKRFEALRAWRPFFDRVWGLTGTPAPNSYLDLWAQVRFLDDGKRLGRTFTKYKDMFFRDTAPADENGEKSYSKLVIKSSAKEVIEDKISDLCLTMLSDDYLDVPTPNYEDRVISLNKKARAEYDEMERELLLQLEEGDVQALNAAALTNKLLQITGGAVYDSDKNVHDLHTDKIKALRKIIKDHPGEPILVMTQFKHERARILKAIKGSQEFSEEGMGPWQAGEIPVWVADPRSMSHGIDGIQDGGRIIVWFTLTYSNETYIQANARIVRTGQSSVAQVYRIIAENTIDDAVADAIRAKGDQQEGLFTALKNLQRIHELKVA